jgi:hypothetical protein
VLLLIFVLAFTSTACLRLTPSERSTDDTEDTTSGSSDTTSIDTDHPCDRVSCLDRPNARSCAAGLLTVVAGDGYCALDTTRSASQCRFDTEQVKCPSDACKDTEHCEDAPCHGVRCDRPPPNECLGNTDEDSEASHEHQLLVYEREGRCQGGTDSDPCLYDTATIIDCPRGCDTDTLFGAHCEAEPCRGVVCNQPPARYCADENTLVVWNLFGRCAGDGSCRYERRTIGCSAEGGCKNGRCVGTPCAEMLCYRPPARYCSSAAEVINFSPVGTCDTAGACVYEKIERACGQSDCAGGNCGSKACVEDTDCHTPPAPYCNAKGQLVFWDAIPDCNGAGLCYYGIALDKPPDKAPPYEPPYCQTGSCKDGRCEEDPCAGPTWPCPNGVPAVYCANDGQAVRSSARPCTKPHPCGYDTAIEPCPSCKAGVCEPSPSPTTKRGP